MFGKKFTLLHDFIMVFAFFIIALTALFVYRVHSIQSRVLEQEMENITSKVDHNFTESINYTENVLSYMGRLISSHNNPKDYDYIMRLFNDFSKDPRLTETLSWTLVSWVDNKDKLWVDAKLGVLKPEDVKNITKQNHVEKSKEEQWNVQLDEPRKGNTSGKWIIPAAVGVADPNGLYIGSLIFGFDIEKLKQRFAAITIGKHVDFALIGEKHNIILGSKDDLKLDDGLFEQFNFQFNHPQSLSEINLFTGTSYYIYKFPQYPYALYLTYDEGVLWDELFNAFRSNILEILLAFMVLGAMAFYFNKRVILPIRSLSEAADVVMSKPDSIRIPRVKSPEMHSLAKALTRIKVLKRRDRDSREKIDLAYDELEKKTNKLKTSTQELTSSNTQLKDATRQIEELMQIHKDYDEEKEAFLRDMYHTLNTPLNAIINGADIARQELLGPLDLETYGEYLDAMYDAGMQLKCFTTDFVYPEQIDIAAVIKSCVKIQKKSATEDQIILSSDVPSNVPKIWADRLRMRQVILSTLYHSLYYIPKGGKSNISANVECLPDGTPSCLNIVIRDDGFGHNEKNREEFWKERFGENDLSEYSRNPDMMKLSLTTLKHLMKLHHGSFELQAKSGKGSVFTLRLPYLTKDELETQIDIVNPTSDSGTSGGNKKPSSGNIISFPKGD